MNDSIKGAAALNIDSLFTFSEAVTLTADEEAALILDAQAGDEAAQSTLLRAYGPALRNAVGRFIKRFPVEERNAEKVEDTRMEAVTAFFEVLYTHDPEKSPRLAGRMAQALNRALADAAMLDASMTIPERTLSRFYGILREADGDVEAAMELAPAMGMSIHTFNDVRAVVRETLSLTPDDEDDEGDTLLAHPLHSNLRTGYDEAEDNVLIDIAFKSVNDEEARIVELAYGFTEYEPVADAEIAHRMGLTRPTVQRKRGKALDKMRKALGVTVEGN